jgi:hypothetical protein
MSIGIEADAAGIDIPIISVLRYRVPDIRDGWLAF